MPGPTAVVVIGAGAAGLAVAHRCSQLGHPVLIVERDRLVPGALSRSSVPHDAWPHLAPAATVGRLQAWLHPSGLTDGELTSLPTLLWALRRRLARNPLVTIQDATMVVGLAAAEQGLIRKVSTVHRGRHCDHLAALVVDASGRGSDLLGWLSSPSGPPMIEHRDTMHRDWVSGWYAAQLPTGFPERLDSSGPRGRTVAVHQRAGVWCIGVSRAALPAATSGELLAAAAAAGPDFKALAAAARRVGGPVSCRGSGLLSRRPLRGWPDNLLVVGDAAGADDPDRGPGGLSRVVSDAELVAELLDHPAPGPALWTARQSAPSLPRAAAPG